jgi:hypothetical protein
MRLRACDGGEVDYSDGDALPAETAGSVDHQGALAHLAGGEDVAELARQQALVEILIGMALDVGGSILAQRAADLVERVLGEAGHGFPSSRRMDR